MYNKLYYIVAILFATNTLFAQNKISGVIINKQSNQAIAGATIYLSDLKTGVSTNQQGYYEILNIKSGNYLIEASAIGYKPIVQNFVITQDTTIDFGLSESHKEMVEVVVTGTSRSTEIKFNPVIIKAVDKNYLNQNTATNLIDALKNVPGINQITTGASISKPVIRGLGYNRVITLLNGIKQEGQQWGDEHGIEIDEYAIDRIELIKGPGSLMYGSDGIAGVLNFISPKAPPVGKMKTQLLTNYQSNNNLMGYSVMNAGNKNGLQWLARISGKNAGNIQNKFDDKVYNSGFSEINANAFVGINRNWGHSHLHLGTFNTTIALPEGDRDSNGKFIFENANGDEVATTNTDLKGYQIGFPHQVVNHLRLSSNNYFLFKKGTVNVDIGFQNNKRKEYADVAMPDEIELFFNLNTINYNARYNMNKRNGWETSIGMGGMQQGHTNRGVEYLIPDYNLLDIGAYAHTQKTINNKLTLAGGLRYDIRNMNSNQLLLDTTGTPTTVADSSNEIKFNAIRNKYTGFSGSLGLSYQLNQLSTLKLNVSRGNRAPNIAEIASNGRHEGTFRYEIGNPNLKSETNHQIDLAYFLNSEHITLEVSPFVNFISNYIYTSKLADSMGNEVIIDPSDPAPAFEFAQAQATLLGGEIYLDMHPHPFDWLHIANSFAIVQATQRNASDSTRFLPFIPAPKYRGELKAELKTINKVFNTGYLKLAVDHFFAQNNIYKAYGTETATPSYSLLSAGIGSNIKLGSKKDALSIFINADNLLDRSYQNHLSRLKYAPLNIATNRNGIFNAGRNFSIKLLVNL